MMLELKKNPSMSFMYDFGEGHTGNGAMLPNSEMRISDSSCMDANEDGDETISNDSSSYELKLQPIYR